MRLRRNDGELTPRERTFLDHYTKGVPAYAAAKIAGYKSITEATRLLSRPAITDKVRELELAFIDGELFTMANDVLRRALDVEGSTGIPWPTRMKAVEIVHKRRFRDDAAPDAKQLSDMSPGELADMLEKLHAKAADMAKDVEGVVIEQNTQPGDDLFG